MGSGKSVIGKELASFYKLSFFDSDDEIEKILEIKLIKFSKIMVNYILERLKKKYVKNF